MIEDVHVHQLEGITKVNQIPISQMEAVMNQLVSQTGHTKLSSLEMQLLAKVV